jgi:hypothetical protein
MKRSRWDRFFEILVCRQWGHRELPNFRFGGSKVCQRCGKFEGLPLYLV